MKDFKIILSLIRWDRPAGTMLLFWPCAFGVAINSSIIDYFLILKFLLGSFVMRSAGCIINDMWDRDFDSKVERTKTRPLASKAISPLYASLILMIFLAAGFLLLCSFKLDTILFSMLSVPLIIIYPVMKRITYFPQFFLGFTFNFGILVASKEILGHISLHSIILYLGTVFWVAGYDTIYGYMDIKDDKKIGVKSLSIYIEHNHPKIWLSIFYILFFIFLILAGQEAGKINSNFDFAVIFLIFVQLAWQVLSLKIDSPIDCMQKFKSNMYLGALITTLYLS